MCNIAPLDGVVAPLMTVDDIGRPEMTRNAKLVVAMAQKSSLCRFSRHPSVPQPLRRPLSQSRQSCLSPEKGTGSP
jgi:hypothetical protein